MLQDIPQERIELLKTLATEYRLLALSNTNSAHIGRINEMLGEACGLNLSDLFSVTYYSYEIGLRKPNPDVFHYVLKAESIMPDETLFLDDKPENVNSAKKVGLWAEWVTETNPLLNLFS